MGTKIRRAAGRQPSECFLIAGKNSVHVQKIELQIEIFEHSISSIGAEA